MRSDEFMNAEDVARYLSLGKNTVYQLAKTGKLASYHVGRKLKFTLDDVEAYVASTHQAPSPQAPFTETDDASADGMSTLPDAASFGFLEGDPFIVAGGDAVADILASALNVQGISSSRMVCGSYTALVNLYAGQANAAVIHLYDQASNSYNLPYVRNLAPGASVVVFRLYGRQQGFIVRSGNPSKITTWGALLRNGVRLANREKGSGSRVLLDEKLRVMEARSETIEGYDTHYAVGNAAARRVAGGVADVAIGTERDIRGVSGLQFVPMQLEWVDLVVRKTPDTREVVRRLKELMGEDQLRQDVASLQPCDIGKFGVIVYES